jgi:hypothetical protein
VAFTSARTCAAVAVVWKAPPSSGATPLVPLRRSPMAPAWRASTAQIDRAAVRVAGSVMFSAWPP